MASTPSAYVPVASRTRRSEIDRSKDSPFPDQPSPDLPGRSSVFGSKLMREMKIENFWSSKHAGYTWAVDAVLRSHLFFWSEYTPTAYAMKVYVLTPAEFARLLEALFLLVTTLLDEWLELALDKVEEAYRSARESRSSTKWPLYAGSGYVLSADACF